MSLNKLNDDKFSNLDSIFKKRNEVNRSVPKFIQLLMNESATGASVSAIVLSSNANFGSSGKIKALSIVYFSVSPGGLGTFRTGYLEVIPSKDYISKFQSVNFNTGANYTSSAIIPISNGQPITTWRGGIPFDSQTNLILRVQPFENVPITDVNTVYILLEFEPMSPHEF